MDINSIALHNSAKVVVVVAALCCSSIGGGYGAIGGDKRANESQWALLAEVHCNAVGNGQCECDRFRQVGVEATSGSSPFIWSLATRCNAPSSRQLNFPLQSLASKSFAFDWSGVR